MDRRQLDMLVPMLYGLVVVVCAIVAGGTVLTLVAVVGAMLVGIYFAVLRRSLPAPEGGRERNRQRNRQRNR